MTISSKLALGSALLALAAGSAYADYTPNLQDSSGHAVRDGAGHCVVTSGLVLPECAGVKAPEPAAPAAPSEPATPAAPEAPAPTPAKPAPSSVRQSVVFQADALFDFDKSVVRADGT
jgi:OOP family OmpA-OmpF porin